jgi:hypothetical protein
MFKNTLYAISFITVSRIHANYFFTGDGKKTNLFTKHSPSLSKTLFSLPLRVLVVFQPLVCVSCMLDHKRASEFVNIEASEFNVNRYKYLILVCFYLNFTAVGL